MTRTRMMLLAAVFLALALILPIYMVVESWNADFADLEHRGPLLDDTDIQSYFQDAIVRHQTLLTLLVVIEVLFLALFVFAFRAALRP